MIFNMVGGGGGSLKDTDAVLIVTVLTGSTVTATKSGTTLTPTMWVQSADNTRDTAIFIVKASTFDANAWTVTAVSSDNTKSQSRTVVINAAEEYSIDIYFGRLYWDGDKCTAVTGGWEQYNINAGSTYTRKDIRVTENVTDMFLQGSTTAKSFGVYGITNQIDLSPFSTLYITFSEVGVSNYTPHLNVLSANSASRVTDVQVTVLDLYTAGVGTRSLDVSGLNSSYYIGIDGGQGGSSNISYVRVNRVWLE